MSRRKYASARDGNEAEIITALRAVGCTVQALDNGDGRPDLLVGVPAAGGGRNVLMEVKNASARAPGAGNRLPVADFGPGGPYEGMHPRLRPRQARWHKAWATRVYVVETPEQALAAALEGEAQ